MHSLTLAAHVFGALIWFGGTMTALHVILNHARATPGERGSFQAMEGGIGRIMDIGATLSLVTGIAMLVGDVSRPLLKMGFMHTKLTLVLVLLGLHGVVRARLAKYRRGEVNPLGAWVMPAVVLVFLGVVVLIETRPF